MKELLTLLIILIQEGNKCPKLIITAHLDHTKLNKSKDNVTFGNITMKENIQQRMQYTIYILRIRR